MPTTILVIDDNAAVGSALRLLFNLHDIETHVVSSPKEGLEALFTRSIDLVIADMNFAGDTTSGDEGAALFHAIRERHPDLPVILLTAWTHLEAAVQLIKAGAADYVAKPWNNDRLLASVQNLLELGENARERRRLFKLRERRYQSLKKQYDLRDMVFESEAMSTAVELACQVARGSVPVLITGPNGAGKERIAAIVHANSSAREGPFVAVNCGALPAELIEAELFGAEAGAFTGAHRPRVGRFELANGGTFFLDEIGNLPLSGQAKLLRALETGQFEQVGSSHTRSVRVRIVSATSADLRHMIQEGQFREDLYYRLNVVEVFLPPLAERTDDILPLADHFLGAEFRLSEDALSALMNHDWPGNVRELRNSIERAKLLARDGFIRAADLNLSSHSRGGVNQKRGVEDLSADVIASCLSAARGNVSRAAQALGISRQSLYRRMERLKLRT